MELERQGIGYKSLFNNQSSLDKRKLIVINYVSEELNQYINYNIYLEKGKCFSNRDTNNIDEPSSKGAMVIDEILKNNLLSGCRS